MVSPLAEFAHMSTADAITNFTMAFQRMQTASVFAAPSHSAQAMMFVSALQKECLKALTAGATLGRSRRNRLRAPPSVQTQQRIGI